jgi:hypothetical protein
VTVGVVSHKQHKLAPITLSNGTIVTVTVTNGSATVSNAVDDLELTLSGTPNVAIKSSGVVRQFNLSSVTSSGNIGTFKAPLGLLTGTFSVAGKAANIQLRNISGTLAATAGISSLKLGGLDGVVSVGGAIGTANVGLDRGTIAAARINTFIASSVESATVLAGANLGSDNAVGGTGGAADTYSTGEILTFKATGQITDSFIGAGVSPGPDGIFGTSDDVLLGKPSRIGIIHVTKGNVDSASHFESVSLPKAFR